MRNRSSTGVLSSPAPHLAGELQSSLCMYSMHVCTKQDLILLFLLLLFVKITSGDILQPPPATPLAGGFQSACCMPYVQKLCLCYSFVPSSELYHAPCTTYHVSRTTCPVPRAPYLAPCISYLVPRTLYLLTQHPLRRIDIFLGLVGFVG